MLLDRIWIDPKRCGGRPCLRGRRIWVSLVLDRLAAGEVAGAIMADLDLAEEDIHACLAYASEIANQTFVDLALMTKCEPFGFGSGAPSGFFQL